jgi:tRNA G18 (ribose-2'-O)-methylase SpoU
MAGPSVSFIDSLDDPRVRLYRDLKDRDLAREGGRFIAEGETVVRRLLASGFATESVLLAGKRLERMLPAIPPHVPVYAGDAGLVNRILGYKFHSGVMAVGIRGPTPTLDQLAGSWTGDADVTLVILPEIANTDNLGSLIRISAAFGVSAVILGERCCDPFYRQSVRVSMGSIFQVPIRRSTDLSSDLRTLRQRHGMQLIATVLDGDAQDLARAQRTTPRIGLLFGNEAQGLGPSDIAACDRRVTIPMRLGTDSLNVSVAAGIVLYHFTHRAEAILAR